jgi:hypothetical protein
MKTSNIIKASSTSIALTLLDLEMRKLIDPYGGTEFYYTKKLADNTYATYMRHKKFGLIKSRDFSLITFVYEHEDNSGKITVLRFSDSQIEKEVPKSPSDVIRGYVHLISF